MRRWAFLAVMLAAAAGAAYLGAGLVANFREASMPEPGGGRVRVLRGGAEAEISGPLALALDGPLRAALQAGAKTVQIDSLGGSIAAARALAASIRAAGAETAVTDNCYSTCAAVFMAGRRRWAGPFSQLALEAEAGGVSLLRFYREAAIPASILPAVAATPPGQGWFPTATDLLESGMATDLAEPGQFALAGFGPEPSLASIEARLLNVPAYRAIAEADPAGWADDVAVWGRSVLNGQPGEPAFARTREHLSGLFQRALPLASDALLLEHGRLFVEKLAWLDQHDAAACVPWASSLGGLPGAVADPLEARWAAFRLAIVQSGPREGPVPVSRPVQRSCRELLLAWRSALDRPLAAQALRSLIQQGG